MDRTSRPFRETDTNFPVPGIAYRGIAVPIIRSMLLVSTQSSPRR